MLANQLAREQLDPERISEIFIFAGSRLSCLFQDIGMSGRPGSGISKARLVITAVVVEGRSQGEVARVCGGSQGWVSRLVARYRAEGEAAFGPRPRRPETSPAAISAEAAALITGLRKDLAGQGLDAGPHTIAWHLAPGTAITRSSSRPPRSAGT